MSDHDPFDIATNEAALLDAQVRKRLEAESEESDLKWLMSSRRGRRIVWRQLDRAGVFRLSFNTNAMAMAFAEGNRNDGLRLLMMIHTHAPDAYSQMLKEAQDDARNNADDGSSRKSH